MPRYRKKDLAIIQSQRVSQAIRRSRQADEPTIVLRAIREAMLHATRAPEVIRLSDIHHTVITTTEPERWSSYIRHLLRKRYL